LGLQQTWLQTAYIISESAPAISKVGVTESSLHQSPIGIKALQEKQRIILRPWRITPQKTYSAIPSPERVTKLWFLHHPCCGSRHRQIEIKKHDKSGDAAPIKAGGFSSPSSWLPHRPVFTGYEVSYVSLTLLATDTSEESSCQGCAAPSEARLGLDS